MRTLTRVLVACVLVVVVLEGLSFLTLGMLARRGGYASTYFGALLPHPAISRRAAEVALEVFKLVKQERRVRYQGDLHGAFEWHPLLSYYRPIFPDGTLRARPTFSPNELVVYLLGGSVVEAGGIARHLEADLQAQLKDRYEVRVINEGVGGYISTQEMVLLETKILPFGNPHYVIAVDGYNDWLATVYNLLSHAKERAGVTDDLWPQAELSWFYYWFDEWSGRKAINTIPGVFAQLVGVSARQVLPRTYTGWLVNHLRNWAQIMLLPKFGIRDPGVTGAWGAEFDRTPQLPRARAELQVLNARMMAEASRARGARFFWALQPSLSYRAGPSYRGEAITYQERLPYLLRPSVYWQSLEHYYQDIREVVQEDPEFWSHRFLDLSTPPTDAAGPFFNDTVHLTDVGEDYTAKSLATLILMDLRGRGSD